MENAIVPIADIERMGMAIAKSGLFGMKTPEQAIALMLIANAEGLHPAVAARDYDVIQGRPALKAKAKLGRFQKSGGKFRWLKRTDTECSAEFSHPACPDPVVISWDIARSATAGLGGKDNWKKYPRQMLSARVISEGVDATYPDAGGNMYVPEEVQDFDEPIKAPIREVKAEVIEPVKPIDPILPKVDMFADFCNKVSLCESSTELSKIGDEIKANKTNISDIKTLHDLYTIRKSELSEVNNA
jgi:hypothetical protein